MDKIVVKSLDLQLSFTIIFFLERVDYGVYVPEFCLIWCEQKTDGGSSKSNSVLLSIVYL